MRKKNIIEKEEQSSTLRMIELNLLMMITFLVVEKKSVCMLEHIRNWFNLFVDHHNKEVMD
jgi:hypothetical protein